MRVSNPWSLQLAASSHPSAPNFSPKLPGDVENCWKFQRLGIRCKLINCYFFSDQLYNWSTGNVNDKHNHIDEQRDLDNDFGDDDHDGNGNEDV